MFRLRKPSPFTRIADQTPLRLLPRPVEAVTLRGFIADHGAPFAPPEALGVQVVTSTVTHHVFAEPDREDLEGLVGFHCWDDAGALIEDIDSPKGSDIPSDADRWVAAGLLARFPGEFTPAEVPTVFKGLAPVSLTHHRLVEPLRDDEPTALLYVPDEDDEPLRIPVNVHAVLRRSDGSTDLPTLLLDHARGDLDALAQTTTGVIAALPHLLGNRVVALVHAR